MKFKGRVIPSIPPAEKAYLDKIQPIEGKCPVAEHRLRRDEPDTTGCRSRTEGWRGFEGIVLEEGQRPEIGPMTIYSNNLDMGNVIELAIHPEKLADALRLPADDAWAWLNHLQGQVARTATSKTSLKYPRVGFAAKRNWLRYWMPGTNWLPSANGRRRFPVGRMILPVMERLLHPPELRRLTWPGWKRPPRMRAST